MAMKEGAFGYIQKPINADELEIAIYKALEMQEMKRKLDAMGKIGMAVKTELVH